MAKRRRSSCGVDVVVVAGGLRIFNEDGSPNLFSLYQGDLGEKVLSFLPATEHLCKLDTINKQFQELTAGLWAIITNNRYGLKNGKQGWIKGNALLRKPIYIHINKAPGYENNMYYAGSPSVTTHNSLVAVDSDDGIEDGAPQGIGLYNAQDLSYIGPQAGGGWKTTMAGLDGSEIFVSNHSHNLDFRRENVRQRHSFPNNRNGDGIPVIACETHVIAVTGNTVKLYRVGGADEMANELVVLCQTVPLGRSCSEEEHYINEIHWGSNPLEFIIYHSLEHYSSAIPGTFDITVWSLDAENDRISQSLAIEAGIDLRDVALAEDYVVGASADKKIHVWDRHTKEKKPFVLCDVEDEEDELEEWSIIHSLCLSCHGHMLVSTSHLGCALCVWNIKTGQLLKRYNDAELQGRVDMLPDGNDVTSMAYLKDLNGYICVSGFLDVWTFPTNQQQKDMAISICRREQELRRRRSLAG